MEHTLTDLEGNSFKLSDHAGKVIILNFWAPWCMPCITEMPSLHNLAKLYIHDDFVVIAVAKDTKGFLTPKDLRKRGKFYHILFGMDGEKGALFETFKVDGLPTTIIIDQKSRIVGKLVGSTDWVHEDILNLMQRYIEGDIPAPTPISFSERFHEVFESVRRFINNLFHKDQKQEALENVDSSLSPVQNQDQVQSQNQSPETNGQDDQDTTQNKQDRTSEASSQENAYKNKSLENTKEGSPQGSMKTKGDLKGETQEKKSEDFK